MTDPRQLVGALCRLGVLACGLLIQERAVVAAGDAVVASESAAAPAGDEAAPRAYFQTDVVPLLTRYGCNAGGCHGKATGQGGFQLSLLGYEPQRDYEAIVRERRGRRIHLAAPAQSLLLRKATAQVPHGGGRRLDPVSDDYRVLHDWLAQGAAPPSPHDPALQGIEIRPTEHDFRGADRQLQLTVTARFSDGTQRDVTRQAVYQGNDPELAEVGDEGLLEVKSRPGLFAVMVRYGEQFAIFHGIVARETADVAAELDAWERQYARSSIDRQLAAQWRRLGILPSSWATDGEFVRRATLDICGTLPTVAEVDEYVRDTRPDKRARLVDRLLERPEYASYFGLKWADLLRNRGRGYATSKQRPGTALFAGWIRDAIAENMPYDEFVTAVLTASGSQEVNPPTLWYRSVRSPQDYVESVAQAFLGVRIQCAQCHHHPAERWGQDDYYGLAAAFARIGRKGGFADAEVPTNEVIFLLDPSESSFKHPRTGKVVAPRPLGGPDFALSRYDDPRGSLARWMTSPENPYFARTFVNRMWGHFFGRGIIHPLDDFRSTNPPANPALLAELEQQFQASGYDMRSLLRSIGSSSAYALSSRPNQSNREDTQSYARYYLKRMPAEVLLDAVGQVLDVPTRFPNVTGEFPLGTRAIELPDEAVPSHFLDVFGRPARNAACECERDDSPALGQTLELVSSQEIHHKLTAAGGYIDQLLADTRRTDQDRVRDIFLRCYARAPRAEDLHTAMEFLQSQTDRREAYRSLLWALLATNEFLFNH
ncbi:MAG: DUF1549 and DUF1553 domain-containing protein [Pirellulaceae bacterium]